MVSVVLGKASAEAMVEEFNGKLTAAERDNHWSHYCEPTDMKPGTDPILATKYWWQDREVRRA